MGAGASCMAMHTFNGHDRVLWIDERRFPPLDCVDFRGPMSKSPAKLGLCLLALVGVLPLWSCGPIPSAPPIAFDDKYLNKQIQLAAPPFMNSLKTGDPLWLELSNVSGEPVVFPADYQIRVFRRVDGTWSEIGELPTYRNPEDHVIHAPGAGLSTDLVVLVPRVEDPQQEYLLRVYVVGAMQQATGAQQVGAFVDVELRP